MDYNIDDNLWEWLKKNNIDMTPTQWMNHCLKRLGLVDDKINPKDHNKFRRQMKKRAKHGNK